MSGALTLAIAYMPERSVHDTRAKARLTALDGVLSAIKSLRLPRPEKVDWMGRPSRRRRVGDVVRWKENHRTLDAVEERIRGMMQKEIKT